MTSVKTCFKCGATKPLDEFYPHRHMSMGRLNKCKVCTRLDVAARYRSPEGRKKVAEYERKRAQSNHRRAKALEYQRERRKRNPEKAKAHSAVSNAIRDGRLVRKPCEICGDPNSQAHHLDYNHPLAVRWMCFKHHREIGHGQTVTTQVNGEEDLTELELDCDEARTELQLAERAALERLKQ